VVRGAGARTEEGLRRSRILWTLNKREFRAQPRLRRPHRPLGIIADGGGLFENEFFVTGLAVGGRIQRYEVLGVADAEHAVARCRGAVRSNRASE
jgi:hypothetical protein